MIQIHAPSLLLPWIQQYWQQFSNILYHMGAIAEKLHSTQQMNQCRTYHHGDGLLLTWGVQPFSWWFWWCFGVLNWIISPVWILTFPRDESPLLQYCHIIVEINRVWVSK